MNSGPLEELDHLVNKLIECQLSGSEANRLDTLLSGSAEAVRRYHELLDNHEALCAIYPGEVYESSLHSTSTEAAEASSRSVGSEGPTAAQAGAKWDTRTKLLAIAGTLIFLLSAGLFLERREADQSVATVVGINGALIWTGDGGRVVQDLSLGQELPGGTVEGVAPSSWIELQFQDGSTVGILGNSTLTFSDLGRKELHLKAGKLSCDVRPQPTGRPMFVHTRSALLEVLGTQFEVDAGLSSTVLDVNEGVVRLKRLSDGESVDVPARHRAIADTDQAVTAILVPDSISRWQSQLQLGPDYTQGKWSPQERERDATLRAVPYSTVDGRTIYTVGFGVSRGGNAPIVLQPGSRLRVRGRLAASANLFFGVTVRHAGGGFAGRFQTIRPAASFQGGEDFELTLELREFRLDVSLEEMEDKLPSAPFHLVVETFWCHSLYEPAGLEISRVELIPPAADDGALRDQKPAQD